MIPEARPEQVVGGSRIDWRQAGLLLALMVPIVVFWDTRLVWPLKVLVVFFHELSHGIAALLTGGSIERIEVVAAQGGLCVTRGGNAFLVLTAGYLGSLVWGGIALVSAARTRRDRGLTVVLGLIVLGAAALWIRPFLAFGFAFHAVAGIVLIAAGMLLPEPVCDALLKVFGLASVLYVVPDIWSDTIARSGLRSDARMLAEMTHVPTVVWGVVWIVLAVVAAFVFLGACCRSRRGAVDDGRRAA